MDCAYLAKLGLPLVGLQPRTPQSAPPAHDEGYVLGADARALAESMCRPLSVRDSAGEVSVISFNMLLKAFENKPYYPEVPANLRSWDWRKQQLRAMLAGVDSDLYLMQEVEVNSFAEEFAFLADIGYAAVEPKDGKGPSKRDDVAKCAILYKASRFEMVWSEHRSRVVLAAMTHVESGQCLYVANCHLEGAPWEAATRFTQTKNALEQMSKDMRARGIDPQSCAMLFAGDFNGPEDCATCHCLRTGGLSKDFRDPWAPEAEITKANFAHEFKLADLYAPGWGNGSSCRPPTFAAPGWKIGTLDYIFFSHLTLKPVAVRAPFTEAQLEDAARCGIPSVWHFSDHVPIGGVFEIASVGGCTSEYAQTVCHSASAEVT